MIQNARQHGTAFDFLSGVGWTNVYRWATKWSFPLHFMVETIYAMDARVLLSVVIVLEWWENQEWWSWLR